MDSSGMNQENSGMNKLNPTNTKPSLKLLQDIYTHHLDCGVGELEVGDRLKTWDNQIFELTLNDTKREGIGHRLGTLLKDTHFAALYRLKRVGEYIQGEYEPISEDEEFLNEFKVIWPEFIESWYFRDVYIGFGEDLIEIEKNAINKQDLTYRPNRCKFYSRFRLYNRIDEDKLKNKKGEYTSILSGVTGLKIDNERLVNLTCNEGANFLQWMELIGEYNAGNQKFISAFNASIKRLSVMVVDQKSFIKEMKQLDNNEIFWAKFKDQTRGVNNNKDKTIEIMPPELAMQVLNLNQAYFETQAAWLGFTGKGSSNKASGVSPEETYQDTRIIENIRQSNLRKLNVAAWQMKQILKGAIPEDFEFIITGTNINEMQPQEQMQMNMQEEEIEQEQIEKKDKE